MTSENKTLKFHNDSYESMFECGYCGRPRIDRLNDQCVWVVHTRTVDEFEAAIQKEAAERNLDTDDARDRSYAEREVGWIPGHRIQKSLSLCSRCFAKVRVCATCDYFGEHDEPGAKTTVFRCHADHMTFTRGDTIAEPHKHFCGTWSQAEPFDEQHLLDMLRANEKATP